MVNIYTIYYLFLLFVLKLLIISLYRCEAVRVELRGNNINMAKALLAKGKLFSTYCIQQRYIKTNSCFNL
jgi:hypothetical protein